MSQISSPDIFLGTSLSDQSESVKAIVWPKWVHVLFYGQSAWVEVCSVILLDIKGWRVNVKSSSMFQFHFDLYVFLREDSLCPETTCLCSPVQMATFTSLTLQLRMQAFTSVLPPALWATPAVRSSWVSTVRQTNVWPHPSKHYNVWCYSGLTLMTEVQSLV